MQRLSGRAAFRLVVLPPLARVSAFGPERTWPYGIRLGDLALFALHLNLEEFLFDSVHQFGRGPCCTMNSPFLQSTEFGLTVSFFFYGSWRGRATFLAPESAGAGVLPRCKVDASDEQGRRAAQNPPPVLLQRIGSVGRRTQPSTRRVVGIATRSAASNRSASRM